MVTLIIIISGIIQKLSKKYQSNFLYRLRGQPGFFSPTFLSSHPNITKIDFYINQIILFDIKELNNIYMHLKILR